MKKRTRLLLCMFGVTLLAASWAVAGHARTQGEITGIVSGPWFLIRGH